MQGWDDLHSVGYLNVEGTRVQGDMAKPPTSGIFVLQEFTIKARTGWKIDTLILDVRGHQISPGLGCFKTGEKLLMGPAVLTHIRQIADVEQMQLTKDGVQLSSSLQKSKCFKPITRKEKKAEYLRQLVDNAKKASPKAAAIDAARAMPQQKCEWLEDTFKLKQQPCLKGKEQLEAAVNLLLKHWDLFSHDGSYGHTHLLQHRIITEDMPPIKCRYWPINPWSRPCVSNWTSGSAMTS